MSTTPQEKDWEDLFNGLFCDKDGDWYKASPQDVKNFIKHSLQSLARDLIEEVKPPKGLWSSTWMAGFVTAVQETKTKQLETLSKHSITLE